MLFGKICKWRYIENENILNDFRTETCFKMEKILSPNWREFLWEGQGNIFYVLIAIINSFSSMKCFFVKASTILTAGNKRICLKRSYTSSLGQERGAIHHRLVKKEELYIIAWSSYSKIFMSIIIATAKSETWEGWSEALKRIWDDRTQT